jgi:PAS domain S-box-containing protein
MESTGADHRRSAGLQLLAVRLAGALTVDEVASVLVEQTMALLGVKQARFVAGAVDEGALAAAGFGVIPVDWRGRREGTVIVGLDAGAEELAAARPALEAMLAHAGPALQRARRAAMLLDIDQLSTRAGHGATALQELARLLVPDVCDLCLVNLIDDSVPSIERLATAAASDEAAALLCEVEGLVPLGLDSIHVTAQAIRTGSPLLLEAIDDEVIARITRAGPYRELWRKLAPQSAIIVPMELRGQVLGGVALAFTGRRRFHRSDVPFAQLIAGRAALLVENTRLRREIGVRDDEKQAQQRAVRSAVNEWRNTFDAVELPVFLLDGNGRVHRANVAARRLAGALAERLINGGPAPHDAIEPWTSAARLARQVAADRRPQTVEVVDAATHRSYEISASLQRQLDDEQAATGVIVIVRDISEIVELQESLRRSEMMSAMGALVAAVAHEVRNPLFGISATLDAFEARFGAQPPHQRYLEVLRGEVGKLTRLLGELLEYGRAHDLDRRAASLTDVLLQARHSVAAGAEAGQVAIELALPDDLPPLDIDPHRMGQVFQNLLQNAIQHTPPGGRVHVGAVIDRRGREPRLRVTVRDSGCGFAEEDLTRVFTPFFTRRRGGTGLGLSIVQRIVEKHGGKVDVANAAAGGALVAVELPLPLGPPS